VIFVKTAMIMTSVPTNAKLKTMEATLAHFGNYGILSFLIY